MNIHAAIKAGQKNSVSVSNSHPTQTTISPKTESNPTQETTPPPATTKSEIAVKPVDISIAGTPHRIVCPVDEVGNLENAAKFINEKIRDIRHGSKGGNPNNESLLVLTCLELYDQIQLLKNEKYQYSMENERARTLLEKILKDARSVL